MGLSGVIWFGSGKQFEYGKKKKNNNEEKSWGFAEKQLSPADFCSYNHLPSHEMPETRLYTNRSYQAP